MFVFDILLFCLEIALGILMIVGLIIGVPFLVYYAIKYMKWAVRKDEEDDDNIKGEQPSKGCRTYSYVKKCKSGSGDESGEIFDGIREDGEGEEEYFPEGASDEYIRRTVLLRYGRLLDSYRDAKRKD